MIFTIECIIKIIALGFRGKKKSSAYIRDPWNKLDFFVVIISLIGMLPGLPNLSVLRTFRVLRPLRTLARSPGLRKIIGCVIDSIPDLANVIVLLCFVLLIFSIAGLVFWNGLLHARCRLTPFPIKMPADETCVLESQACYQTYIADAIQFYSEKWDYLKDEGKAGAGYDPLDDPYRCLQDAENNDPNPTGSNKWTKDSSPWSTEGGLNCIWPLDTNDERVCSLSGAGTHQCRVNDKLYGADDYYGATCGSDFDNLGNPRFLSSMEPYGSIDRMVDGEFTEALSYGYTSYDNIFRAFVATFQACSMEGWTVIMYQTMDAWSVGAAFIFVVLVLIGGNIVLNLVLAVVSSALDKLDEDEDEDEEGEEGGEGEGEGEGGEQAGEEKEKGKEEGAEEEEVAGPRGQLRKLVKNATFGKAIMLCILINTVVLACDYDGIEENKGFSDALELINNILTFVFLLECLLCIAGLGYKEYFGDAFSCFDFVIVVFSMIDFVITATASDDEEGGGGAISALRGARLLRVLKMAKGWDTMQTLLKLIAKTVFDVGNFGILLLLFIFIYSLCGMQFFSNRMVFDDMNAPVDILDYEKWQQFYPDRPRNHFDNIHWSMVTVFQILTGEDWNACMYDGWRCAKIPELAIFFYLSLVILGAFIVMNLFLAILLSNFEGNEDLMKDTSTPQWSEFDTSVTVRDMANAQSIGLKWKRNSVKEGSSEEEGNNSNTEEFDNIKNSEGDGSAAIAPSGDDDGMEEAEANNMSLFIFSQSNPVRQACTKLAEHKFFDSFILVCILVSSFCLALDNPLSDKDSTLNKILKGLDLFFTVIFIIELVTKVISLGFVLHKGSYIRNPWNVLDAVIVLISILSLSEVVEGGSLKALRTFRVLRPLRMIKRFPELKLVVDALVSSVPDACNVIVISALFLLLFAILGVNFFKGTFMTCAGPGYDDLSDNLADFLNQYPDSNGNPYAHSPFSSFATAFAGQYDTTKFNGCNELKSAAKVTSKMVCDCLFESDDETGWGDVMTPGQNFNDVGKAFALLFEITTTEGWTAVTYAAVDNMGKDMQHKRDAHPEAIIFFILFMLVGAFFVMELFVGVVIDNFNRLREKKGGGSLFMTESQEEWAKTQAFIMRIKPEKRIHPPAGKYALWCYNFVMPNINPRFDQSIMGCILANSVVMAFQHHGQSETFTLFIDVMNYIFALVFTVEAILKMYAMKTKYFRDAWNKFDFIVVLGTNTGILIKWITGGGIGAVASIVRMFRIGRLVRLINSAKSIRTLFNTLVTSIPSMANIGFLLLILFFIFSVMGVQSYAKIQLDGDDLTVHANFQTIPESFLLLFRFATGENWNGFMHTLMAGQDDSCEEDHEKIVYDPNKPFCISESDYELESGCTTINGCGSGAAISPRLFFYCFTLMVTFVMLNLFVGVVLDAFDSSEEGDLLGPEDLDKFTETWSEFDPDATWHIKVSQLKQFVDDLDKPMGFGKEYKASDDELLNRMRETGMWEIPFVEEDGEEPKVNITHVASSLAKRLVREKQGEEFKDLHEAHPLQAKFNRSVRDMKKTVGDIFLKEATDRRRKSKALQIFAPPKEGSEGQEKPDTSVNEAKVAADEPSAPANDVEAGDAAATAAPTPPDDNVAQAAEEV